MKKRVVITDIQVVSALGDSLEGISHKLKNELYPSLVNNTIPIPDFDLRKYIGRNKDIKYLSRGNQFSVACALRVAENLPEALRADAGLFLGAGPNFDFNEGKSNALWILNFLPNSAANFIAKNAGIHGESATLGTACAASLQALGMAYDQIASGKLSHALAGGGDSRLSENGLKSYADCKALFAGKNPDSNYAPFAKERFGFIPGEGGACFLLEELESALSRKAPIYAEILGTASTCDAYNMTAPHPEGIYAKKAILRALESSQLHPSQIDLISTHGTGTPLNDEAEYKILSEIFSSAFLLSLKSWIGHLSSACGAMELALCLAIDNVLPPIKNLAQKEKIAESTSLKFVTSSLNTLLPIKNILIENFGFGGQNTVLVIKKWNI